MKLCECGCRQEVTKEGNRFISGHNKSRLGQKCPEDVKIKISKTLKGIKLSEETKGKMSEAHMGINNHFYGKYHSEETKKKISKSRSGILTGDKNPQWKGGLSFEPYCPRFNDRLKEEIRNECNRKCQICGKDEKDNITKNNKVRKLSIHHVDMDKEQGCNGKEWNLIPLCMNCHGRLHGDNYK